MIIELPVVEFLEDCTQAHLCWCYLPTPIVGKCLHKYDNIKQALHVCVMVLLISHELQLLLLLHSWFVGNMSTSVL